MITLLSPVFWLSFLWFIIATFLSFFISGHVLLRKIQLPVFSKIVLAILTGMVFWALQGFIFGFLHIRFATYIYLIGFFLAWIISYRKKFILEKIQLKFRIDIVTSILIVAGLIVQLTPVLGFGLQYQKGMFLCCGNREDFLFHVSLTQSIVKTLPPIEPGMEGVIVHNYHYWSNIVVAELVRIYHLPLFYTQFQFMNIFISLLLGLVIIAFATSLQINKFFTRWLLFFFYFGGDAIYAILLIFQKTLLQYGRVSSLEDGSVFLLNPPRAFSIVVVFAAMTLFVYWRKSKNTTTGVISIILFACNIGFKVYTGLFCLLGIIPLILYFFFRKQYKDILILSLFFPISGMIYLSNNQGAGGLFFAPLVIVNDFIVQPAFGLQRWELARQIYLDHHSIFRIIQYEILFTSIFLISLTGSKLIAFFQSYKSYIKLGKELCLFLSAGIIGSLFIGLFFLQQAGGSNTFNFIVSFILFINIPSALAVAYWQEKLPKKLRILFIIFIIIITVPRVLFNTYQTMNEYKKIGYLVITNDELQAFSYIKNSTASDSLFLIDPNIGFDRATPFIAAFTDRPMYLSGDNILTSHGISTKKRNIIYQDIFRNRNALTIASDLTVLQAQYIYLSDNDALSATESASFIHSVFQNREVHILRVSQKEMKEYIKIQMKAQ